MGSIYNVAAVVAGDDFREIGLAIGFPRSTQKYRKQMTKNSDFGRLCPGLSLPESCSARIRDSNRFYIISI